MKIEVEIPLKEAVLASGCPVPLAPEGATWSEKALGTFAKQQGVYVIHHGGTVKYVGKTDGPSMSFGMRLRREFQETASGNRHLYPKLKGLMVPPDIMVHFFAAKEIRGLIRTADTELTNTQCIEIFEAALVQIYQPQFQTQER